MRYLKPTVFCNNNNNKSPSIWHHFSIDEWFQRSKTNLHIIRFGLVLNFQVHVANFSSYLGRGGQVCNQDSRTPWATLRGKFSFLFAVLCKEYRRKQSVSLRQRNHSVANPTSFKKIRTLHLHHPTWVFLSAPALKTNWHCKMFGPFMFVFSPSSEMKSFFFK